MTDIARPTYREGQFLTAADFVAEQAYHRRALGRHQLGEHTWGLVVGLELVEVPDDPSTGFVDVFLSPGLAVDGYGRQLACFERMQLDATAFDSYLDIAYHEVWIQFAETDGASTKDGWADCEQSQPTRAIETLRIMLDPVTSVNDVMVAGEVALPEPAAGASIPKDASVPYQTLPDEPPIPLWLIRVGSVQWDGAARRFRPAGGRRTEGRRFAGVVAADVLAPADTLRLARRSDPSDYDAADFAAVEGRVRVKGRINAEQDLWMEGGSIQFALDDGNSTDPAITLSRDRGPTGDRHRLRLTLGGSANPKLSFSIGTNADAQSLDPVAEVIADGRVRVPLGPLDMGHTHRQQIDLDGSEYGLGTQEGVLYQRSPSRFAWYAGGSHSETPLDPGKNASGFQLVPRLILDEEGALDFGAVTHQMLKLWRAPGTTAYGIGVQAWTLYFRSDADFCWFRDGTHVDTRSGAGAGGTLAMKLGEDSTLEVFGAARVSEDLTVGSGGDGWLKTRHVLGKSSSSDSDGPLFLNWGTGRQVHVGGNGVPSELVVTGAIRAQRTGQSAVESVIKVVAKQVTATNGWDGTKGVPGTWNASWAGELDECYTAFAVLNAFSLIDAELFSANPTRLVDLTFVPQNAWVRVDSFNASGATGQAFLAQSSSSDEVNNALGITVVAIGRRFT